jgi:hypothetical protein
MVRSEVRRWPRVQNLCAWTLRPVPSEPHAALLTLRMGVEYSIATSCHADGTGENEACNPDRASPNGCDRSITSTGADATAPLSSHPVLVAMQCQQTNPIECCCRRKTSR